MTIVNVVDVTCREVTEVASDYLARAMPPDERARFEQHLHACTWCMTFLAQLRTSIAFVRKLGDTPEPAPTSREKLTALFRSWKQKQGQP